MGFGLRTFLGAQLTPGFDIFARYSRIDEKLAKADLILTGEGHDRPSDPDGKGHRVPRPALPHAMGKRCVGFAGVIDGAAKTQMADRLFHSVHAICPTMTSPNQAKQEAAMWLERLAHKVATDYDWS